MPRRAYSSPKSAYLRPSGRSIRHGARKSSSIWTSCAPVRPHHGERTVFITKMFIGAGLSGRRCASRGLVGIL